jgi:ribosomal protein S21
LSAFVPHIAGLRRTLNFVIKFCLQKIWSQNLNKIRERRLINLAIEVRKKDKESTGSLLRRFSKRIQQSGILLQARRSRFYNKPKTKRQKKASALRREELRHQRVQMIKMGLLEEGELIPKDMIKIRKR